MERLSRKGIRPRRKCTGERFKWWWFRCLNHLCNLEPDGTRSRWHVCLLSCSLHPGDLFPFTRKPLFIIVDSSNSTAYKVWSNQELELQSNSLAVDYFHMLIMTHHHHGHHQVPSHLSHGIVACQIRWKTDETVIKLMMCTHTCAHVSRVWYACVIPLWFACDTPVMQDCYSSSPAWYVLGAAERCSHCQHLCDCCLTEFHQSFRPTSGVSAVSHHLSKGCAR